MGSLAREQKRLQVMGWRPLGEPEIYYANIMTDHTVSVGIPNQVELDQSHVNYRPQTQSAASSVPVPPIVTIFWQSPQIRASYLELLEGVHA
ncbi:hypothetical protein Ancab_001398 [Ancistrocladus abbreviatus]